MAISRAIVRRIPLNWGLIEPGSPKIWGDRFETSHLNSNDPRLMADDEDESWELRRFRVPLW